MQFLDEFAIVLSHSTRTIVALSLGAIFFVGFLVVGAHLTSDIQFQGHLSSAAKPIRELLTGRYEKAAFGTLIGFWALAYRFYTKDRKKLFGK